MKKCLWALSSPLEENYHDTQWGIPLHDDQKLFEYLILETQQTGLSWRTILKKQALMKEAYHQFNPHILATLTETQIASYLTDDRVIKHKLKIQSVITNAKAYLELIKTETLNNFLWSYVNHQPIQNQFKTLEDIPSQTKLSKTISQDLKKRGFQFVGPTVIYAYMQAIGMTNDHLIDCPFYKR